MAMTLKEIREQYPQYNSKSDKELADAIHQKYYSSLPKEAVYSKLGLAENTEIPNESKEATGITGVASDVLQGLGNAFSSGKNFLTNIPQNLESHGKYIQENPAKSIFNDVGQVGAEIASLGKGVINAPHDLLKYLARKNLAVDIPIPGTNWTTGDLIPHIPEDTGVEKALGLQPKKSDQLLRGLVDAAALGFPIGQLVSKGVKFAKAPDKQTLFKRALQDEIEKAKESHEITKKEAAESHEINTERAEKEHALTKEQLDFIHGLSEKQLEKLKDSLKLGFSKTNDKEIGALNPVSQEVKANIKENKIAEKKPLTEIPYEEIGEIPKPPETKSQIEAHKAKTEQAKSNLLYKEGLDIKNNPELRGGETVQAEIKDTYNRANKSYNAANDIFKDKKVKVDNSKEIKQLTEELNTLKDSDELAPGYGSGTAEQKELEGLLHKLNTETLEASDLFDLQRTLETMARNTRTKQYAPKVPELERARLGDLAKKLDKRAAQIRKRLEGVGGKEAQKLIKKGNEDWSIYKQMTGENTTGSQAYFTGQLPADALTKIARSEKGNEWLRGLIEKHPEFRQQLLAQHVGTDVKKLLNPTTEARKHITHESLAHIDEKIKALENALSSEKQGIREARLESLEHKNLVKSMTEAAQRQKIRQDAIKESDELSRQIKLHKDASSKLKEQIKKVERSEAIKNKKIEEAEESKAQVIKESKAARDKRIEESKAKIRELEKELQSHERAIQDKGGKLKKLTSFILKIKGIQAIANKVGL